MDKQNNHNTKRRAIILIIAGIILAGSGIAIVIVGLKNYTQKTPVASAYQYTVNQAVQADVQYFDSSYYTDRKPSIENDAYVSDLTNTVQAKFHYAFNANLPTELNVTYNVQAQVQSNYALKGNTETASNVWQKTYQLTKPVVSKTTGTGITLDPSVTVPYSEYKKAAQDFRASLLLPTSGKLVVLLVVQVSGTVNGTAFTDARTSSIAMPLDEQVYQPTIKYDSPETKRITPAETKPNNGWIVGGAFITIAGLALSANELRKRMQKSSYRRELEKIYHYHSGIIVRTSRPVNISGRQIVPMHSFTDMLNLEEELKTPIIADEINGTTTHFIVAHDNVLYRYTLGDTEPEQPTAPSVSGVSHAAVSPVETQPAAHNRHSSDGIIPKKRPLGSHIPAPSTQTTTPLDDDFTDVLDELSRKSSGKPKHK